MNNSSRAEVIEQTTTPDRRHPVDRRKRILRSLFHGSLTPRRRGPRRGGEHSFVSVDWHHPQWLAVAMVTLILSVADAILTLTLLQHGAYEANPFMAPLVHDSPLAFAIVKVALTGGGISVLILLARVRVFGGLPISAILYAVLFVYTVLVGYEFWLLEVLPEGLDDLS